MKLFLFHCLRLGNDGKNRENWYLITKSLAKFLRLNPYIFFQLCGTSTNTCAVPSFNKYYCMYIFRKGIIRLIIFLFYINKTSISCNINARVHVNTLEFFNFGLSLQFYVLISTQHGRHRKHSIKFYTNPMNGLWF